MAKKIETLILFDVASLVQEIDFPIILEMGSWPPGIDLASLVEETDLHPHVSESLKTLKDQGVTLGLYAEANRDYALKQVRRHNLEKFFPEKMIRAVDDYDADEKRFTPDKKEQIASLLKDNPAERAIVVGSDIAACEAARENGAAFAGFAARPETMFQLAAAGAKAVFTSHDRLEGIVGVLTNKVTATHNVAAIPSLAYKPA